MPRSRWMIRLLVVWLIAALPLYGQAAFGTVKPCPEQAVAVEAMPGGGCCDEVPASGPVCKTGQLCKACSFTAAAIPAAMASMPHPGAPRPPAVSAPPAGASAGVWRPPTLV